MLYSNDSFNFNELNAYFNDFSIIIFELQSSSINFTPILKKIKQYKKINEKILNLIGYGVTFSRS